MSTTTIKNDPQKYNNKSPPTSKKIFSLVPTVDIHRTVEKRTVSGGCLSILTFSLFIILMSYKIVNHMEIETPSFDTIKRRLQAGDDGIDSLYLHMVDHNFFSKNNFKFNNFKQTFIDPNKFYKPLKLSSYYVDELNIVLNN